jgi:hypothetical protein
LIEQGHLQRRWLLYAKYTASAFYMPLFAQLCDCIFNHFFLMDPIEVKIVLPDAHQQGIRFCGCNSNAADID